MFRRTRTGRLDRRFDGARVATCNGEIDVSLAVLHARGERVTAGDWIVAALGLALERVDAVDGPRLAEERRTLLRGGESVDVAEAASHVR